MGGILTDLRTVQLTRWFERQFGFSAVKLEVISADASFRRYFRFKAADTSYVLVDAPPDTEKNHQFIALAVAYAQVGLDVPRVLDSDTNLGFMCLTDLGDQTLLPLLGGQSQQWYPRAIKQLSMLANVVIPPSIISYYDREFFELELELFNDWFMTQYLNLNLDPILKLQLQSCFELLITSAISQPQVSVHRDFHSRNLMVRDSQSLAIIDFQDTVTGPLTYDIASLLKDCYFKLSISERDDLLQLSYQMYVEQGLCRGDFLQFKCWFDLMALQRHLKVCGIFSRLYLRDGKSAYLNDLPLVVDYIIEICRDYSQLAPLLTLFIDHVVPSLSAKES